MISNSFVTASMDYDYTICRATFLITQRP